jgi:iron complex outermembrane receptor protein
MRLAFNHETRDSFYDITGAYRGHPGVVDSNSVRASLLWQPTDALRVLLKTDYNNIDLGGYMADPALATNDPFVITSNGPNEAHDEIRPDLAERQLCLRQRHHPEVDHRLSGRPLSEFATDLDGTSRRNNTFYDQLEEEVWSQEFNLISPDHQRLTWLLGLTTNTTWPSRRRPSGQGRIPDRLPGNVVDIYICTARRPRRPRRSSARSATTSRTGCSCRSARATPDSVSTNDDVYRPIRSSGSCCSRTTRSRTTRLTGKVTPELQDSTTTTSSTASSRRVQDGRAERAEPLPAGRSFGPEDVVDYELGWKSTLFGGRVRTQLGAYYTVYEDYQVSIGDPIYPQISRIQNVKGDTTMMGLEASAQMRFGPLSFDVAAAVSNTEMGDFFGADPRSAAPAPATRRPVRPPPTV